MRLGLISPESRLLPSYEGFREIAEHIRDTVGYGYFEGSFSTALLVVAALTPEGMEIQIIDENVEPVPFEAPFDLVGISVTTQQATRAYEIAGRFREKGIFVVMGGYHPTALPEEAKAHADTVILGEAEHTWPRFLSDFMDGRPLPFYRENGEVDLEASPIPRYDLVKPASYKVMNIQASRGCPHDCEFCAASKIYGRKFRHKGVEQVLREVEAVRRFHPSARINFSDDNMFADRTFGKALVRALLPLDLTWSASTDISVAEDEELLALLYQSGCVSLIIGFETVAENTLTSIDPWKGRQREKYLSAIDRIQRHGIGIMGTFIVGVDGDDPSVFDQLRDFALESNIFRFYISVVTPYPGSRLWRRLKEEKRLLDTEWSNYDLWGVNFQPKEMTIQQLQEGVLRLFREIHAPEVEEKKKAYFREIYRKLAS